MLFVVFVVVVILILVSVVVWNVTGTNTLSKLESIIGKVGKSYEDVSTSKDERIIELVNDYDRVRTELAEKNTIIAHLESRISGHTRDTEHNHENYTKRILEMDHLNECLQSRDEELARYKPEIARLETALRHATWENEKMGRKLDIVKQNLAGTG